MNQPESPEVVLTVQPKYVEITLGQTISTGDYGSIRPEFRCGFNVPPGADPNDFAKRTVYPWARWIFEWIAHKQLTDHNGMRENIHTWLTAFFKQYPEAPPLSVRVVVPKPPAKAPAKTQAQST